MLRRSFTCTGNSRLYRYSPSAPVSIIRALVPTCFIRCLLPSHFDVQTKRNPLSHGLWRLSACLPGGRCSLQHPPMLWKSGAEEGGDPREKANWICRHQAEAMIQNFSSGLRGSLYGAEWNQFSFYLGPSSTLKDLRSMMACWGWDIARSRPKRMWPATLYRSLTDGLTGPHNSFVSTFPHLCFFWQLESLVWLGWPWQASCCLRRENHLCS